MELETLPATIASDEADDGRQEGLMRPCQDKRQVKQGEGHDYGELYQGGRILWF